MPSPVTGRPVRRQYHFRLPGARAFLLAAVQIDGMLSIVTTESNESIAPMHNRIPLVLGPEESNMWLKSEFTELADRSGIALERESD